MGNKKDMNDISDIFMNVNFKDSKPLKPIEWEKVRRVNNMTDIEVIDDFKNIVEESRTEDRTEYYIKLRNTLDVLENQQNRITELVQIEEAHRELNGELRKELAVYKDIETLAGTEIREIIHWKYENARLKKELQLKDKMIEEIIDEYAFSDGINIRNFCDEQLRKDKCIENCDKCIKEYFTKKASEDNA